MNDESIFLEALQFPEPDARVAFLDRACAGKTDLRQSVELLLKAHEKAGGFMRLGPNQSTTIDQPNSERPGTVIGSYKLLEEIGEGGMGTVWMAEQTEPVNRKVAVKLIKPGMDSRQVVARFEAERQALALMDHPNIAKVLDGGATPDGRPYFVMELVKGTPITKFCDEKKLNVRERLELFGDVCRAVQHAHQKGIIHRDLKPSNVLVAPYDGRPVVKVIDFGVAKATGQKLTEATLFTGFGAVVGTPEYMSPEQAEVNNQDIDTRSDIYALGVLLYELLTGSTPLTRKRAKDAAFLEVLRVIREEEPPKPSTRLSSTEELPSISAQRQSEPAKLTKLVRGELDWIVMKALEKDRNRRYETANGFAMDVQRYLADEAVQACPPSAGYRFRKFARRNRGRLAAASVLALAALIAFAGVGYAIRDRAARAAEVQRERVERNAVAMSKQEAIIGDVERLIDEQRWVLALDQARRGEAAFSADEWDEELRQRLVAATRNLQFMIHLEEARIERSTDETRDRVAIDQRYLKAFRDHGVDLESTPPEQVASQLNLRPAMQRAIAAIIDDWVTTRGVTDRWMGRKPPTSDLISIARRLDSDPLRDQIRVHYQPSNPEKVGTHQESLHKLAQAIDLATESPQTIITLAFALGQSTEAGLRILKLGQVAHPDDFWINNRLGTTLLSERRFADAAHYYCVALALRPNSFHVLCELGTAYGASGNLENAEACFRNAIRLSPRKPQGYMRLIGILVKQKKWDEVIGMARTKEEMAPGWWHDLDLVVDGLLAAGRQADAQEICRKVSASMAKFDSWSSWECGRTLIKAKLFGLFAGLCG